MGTLLTVSTHSTLSCDECLKILYFVNAFGLFERRGEREVLIVQLDILKACNEEYITVYREFIS